MNNLCQTLDKMLKERVKRPNRCALLHSITNMKRNYGIKPMHETSYILLSLIFYPSFVIIHLNYVCQIVFFNTCISKFIIYYLKKANKENEILIKLFISHLKIKDIFSKAQ